MHTSALLAPSADEYVPALHRIQLVDCCAAETFECVPALHGTQLASLIARSPAKYFPGTHAIHTDAPDIAYTPGPQLVHVSDAAAPEADE